MPWTRAIHLNQWADTELASRHLPLLVRKLIRKTAPDLTRLDIPANEQTVRPGFDGIVESSAGNLYVPSGKSVWEMGTSQNPQSKADSDLALRTQQLPDDKRAETTFVFVTPRPWHKKDEWADKMARQGGWKGVVVHDSNDLEQWLDLARDIDAWISQETKQIPSSVQCLGQYWKSLRSIGAHKLSPEVFTTSRESEIQSVEQFLNRNPDSLFIRTPSLSDGIDFLAALAAQKYKEFQEGDDTAVEPQELLLLQNALLVFDHADWRDLAQSDGPLLLIAAPALLLSSTDVANAVQAGHYVIVSGPRGIVPPDKGIVLRGMQRYELEKALENSGYSDSQAGSLSQSCAGNTTILKRRIASHPDTVLPAWSRVEVATELAFLALIGGWVHVDPNPGPQEGVPEAFRYSPPIDLSILELVGYTPNELDRLITQWQEFPEPFFLRFGDSVLVTSREDAWYLLGDYVTYKQLQQFRDLTVLVLEEDNPALELDANQRWMASIYGKRHSMSGELRKSLVETLAIMATCPTAKHPTPNPRFTWIIEGIIASVLPAKSDWKRWASLRNHLGVIAEAAPDLFLSRIEEDLKSSNSAVLQLFSEETGSLMGGWMYCDFLWALEVLAWCPDYLARVSLIFAKLTTAIHLPGNYGNRPERSLQEIFLLWLPHTNATTKERINALQQVLKIAPAAGWKLIVALLPAQHTSISHPTSMPRWRPWADGWSRETAERQRYDYSMAVVDVAFDVIANDPEKWSEALQGMLRFNRKTSQRVIASLKRTADIFTQRPNEAFKLWDTLRSTIQMYQDYPDANWAYPLSTVQELIIIRDRLLPTDLVLQNLWLFDVRASLSRRMKSEDYHEHQLELEKTRTMAISDIYDTQGIQGILQLIQLGADACATGHACGRNGLITEHEGQLTQWLTSTEINTVIFAKSYISASYYHRGEWDWVNSLNPLNWSPEEKTQLALCLPFEPSTWDWVENQEQQVRIAYWSRVQGFLHPWVEPIARRAISGLLTAQRPFSAISLMDAHGQSSKPSDLIAEVLEAGLSQESSEDMGDNGHSVPLLIGSLQADSNFDRQRLARIEWGYLPYLEKDYSTTRPDTLIVTALESPSFYLELIQCAYRGKNSPEHSQLSSDNERFLARRASELLDYLSILPGMDGSGNLVSQTLNAWIHTALQLSDASGHSDITAHKIGQLIGRAIFPYLDDASFLAQLGPIIEHYNIESLINGLINGILNSRGVTTRDPFEGGKLEHELAAKFGKRAKSVQMASPALAECFTAIQSRYEQHALREDEEAERLRSGR